MTELQTLYNRLVKASMDWSLGVKSESKLAGMALRLIPLVFGHLTAGYIKVTWGFARSVAKMYKKVGFKGLAIYLKACYLLLQHVAGGQIDASPFEFGCNVARTRRGIPRIINLNHRRLIATGDVDVIRFWLSLFGLYRVLPFKGTLKLKTITAPGKDITSFLSEWEIWVPKFLAMAEAHTKVEWKLEPTRDLRITGMPAITKSSPNSGGMAASAGLPLDLLAWWSDPQMLSILREWLALTGSRVLNFDFDGLFNGFDRLTDRWVQRTKWTSRPTPIEFLSTSTRERSRIGWVQALWGKPLYFGRLGFKEEPGKIRVFAMVNLITQTLMYPLHEWIFARLRKVLTDGTFNQYAPVERLIKRFKGADFCASYDLSAATDRLPVAIQVALLKPLLGDRLAYLWAYILVGRPYGLPKVAKSYNLGFMQVYYAVGQPMGALSSWAMLAMTHHAIVQLAASRAYPKKPSWFLDYALLGDDIVLADKLVAKEYLGLMATLGVDVGLAKSLVSSTGSLEFAKRTWVKGRLATPFSLAEMSIAVSNVAALEELWRKSLQFGAPLRLAAVARFSGFGYKNLARLPVAFSLNNRLSRLLGYLHRPGGIAAMTLESWLMSPGPGVLKGLHWEVQREIVGTLVEDVVALITRVLEKAKGEINSAFRIVLMSADRRVRGRTEDARGRKDRRRRFTMKPVYGPMLREMFGEYESLLNCFFKEWVLYPFCTPVSRKASMLTVRLRDLVEKRAVRGFPGLEGTWRWIDDVEAGLSALPSKVDLFSRQDDVVIAPSSVIRVWMRLRRKVSKTKGSQK